MSRERKIKRSSNVTTCSRFLGKIGRISAILPPGNLLPLSTRWMGRRPWSGWEEFQFLMLDGQIAS